MTTGNRTTSTRRWEASSTGPVAIGTLKSRIWSGQDDPQVKARRTQRYQAAVARLQQARILRKQGRFREAAAAHGDWLYWKTLPRRRANGLLRPNPYDVTYEWLEEVQPATWSAGGGVDPWGNPYPNTFGTGGLYTSGQIFKHTFGEPDLNLANSRLRERLVGSSFYLPGFIAEGGEALALIFGSAKVLARTLTLAVSGNWPGVFSELRRAGFNGSNWDGILASHRRDGASAEVASLYLYWSWGVKPLVSDLVAGAECLAHFTEMPFEHRVKVSIPFFSETKPYPTVTKLVGSGASKARLYLRANLAEVDTQKLVGLDGWGAVAGAWEAIPYSWLVDYIAPVQSYLQGRGLAGALKGTFVYSDMRSEFQEVTGSFHPGTPGNPNTWTAYDGHLVWHRQRLKRTVSTTLQVPKVDIVPLSEAASWRRATNILAVLTPSVEAFVRRHSLWQKT